MELEIINRKLLPLSWLEIEDEIPEDLPPTKGRVHPSYKPARGILSNFIALRPYERVRRRYTIACLNRGEHLFGPVKLRSGDLFGFATSERTAEVVDTLVVYPRVVPLDHLGLPARQPLGDLRTQSWVFQDPSRIAGAREYRPSDGLRHIHWQASAKTQRLHTRVYEATTSEKIAIFLNVVTSEEAHWSSWYDPEVLELSITTAASIANWALELGYQVGMHTNGLHSRGPGGVVVEAGRGPSQWERILIALGRLQPMALKRFESLLSQESRGLPFGTTVVLVTAALLDPIAEEALAMRGRGHAVAAILTGRQDSGMSLQGIVVRKVGPPGSWRDTPRISFAGPGASQPEWHLHPDDTGEARSAVKIENLPDGRIRGSPLWTRQ